MAEAFLPPEYVQSILPSIKISYAIPEPTTVAIGITCEHEMIQGILSQYLSMAEMLLPPDLALALNLSVSSWADGNAIA